MSDPEGPSPPDGQPVSSGEPIEVRSRRDQAPALPDAQTQPPHRNQLHLWVFSFITYALVIIFTLLAIWSYRYLEDKTRREQNPLQKDGEPLKPHPRQS
jgi:hypothetical protein